MKLPHLPWFFAVATPFQNPLALLGGVLLCLGSAASPAQSVSFAGTEPSIYVTGLSAPTAMAVDSRGNLFIANDPNSGSGALFEVPAGSSSLITIASGVRRPEGLAVDSADNLFVDAEFLPDPTYPGYFDWGVEELPTGGGSPSTVLASCGPGVGCNTFGIAIDASDNLFLSEQEGGQVIEIPGSGGPPTAVLGGLLNPLGIALDMHGNLFVADSAHARVVKLHADGTQSTVGSNLNSPGGVAVDIAGNIFIHDGNPNRVVEVPANDSPQFTVFSGPPPADYSSLAVDEAGNLFISIDSSDPSSSSVLRVQYLSVDFGRVNVCPTGQTTLTPCSNTLTLNYNVAANTTIGSIKVLTQGAPNLDFQVQASDTSTTLCATGTYSSDTTCTVDVTFTPTAPGQRKGAVEILDGSGNVLANTYIYGIGTAPQIAFSPSNAVTLGSGFAFPEGVAVDASGNVFVADYGDHAVKEILAPTYTTVNTLGSGFTGPGGVAVDGSGNVFVADTYAYSVKEILAPGYTTVNTLGSFSIPTAVAVDRSGNVFVAEFGSTTVKEILAVNGSIPANPTINTLGSGFRNPAGVAVDAAGNVFVGDYGHSEVEEILAVNGSIPTNPTINTLGSGFTGPQGVAVDAAGNVFVADYGNNEVKEIVAVNGSIPASPTIKTLGSGFSLSTGVALDAAGNVFVADFGHSAVKEIQRSQPPSLSFDSTYVGSTSIDSPQSVQFQNIGNATLTGSGLVSDSTDFSVVAGPQIAPDCTPDTLSLAPGAECNLSFDFTPQSAGPLSSTLTLTDNSLNANPATQTLNLSGTGSNTPPLAQAPPNPLNFTTIAFPGSETLPLTITNIGGATLELTAAPTINGPSYSVLPGSNCATGVPANSSCTLQIEFAPIVVGNHPDILSIHTNGGNLAVNLNGTATGVGTLLETPLNFGTIPFGTTKTLPLVISNFGVPGSPTLTFSINGPSYKVLPGSSCATAGVTAGHTCTVQVEFDPVSASKHPDILTLTPSGGAARSTVKLNGVAH